MANLVKAIKDLAAAGHTRKDIRAIMSIDSEDITDVLGKDPRGRKPKSVVVKVEVELPVKAKTRGRGRPKGSKNKPKKN